VLLSTPPWSVAYTGLAAPALALLVGVAVRRVTETGGRRRTVAVLAVVAALVGYAAVSLPALTFGSPFPGRSLEQVLASAPGCVTTDDPIALIETGALQRNFERHCPAVVDLSGYSYDLQPSAKQHLSRPGNRQWQRFAQQRLASGQTSVVVRFRNAPGLSTQTRALVARWPVLAVVAGYEVRRPAPLGGSTR
jgi:hypothetical protein